jgi:hypothetical protein
MAASARPARLLVVGISAGLFDDIRRECGFAAGWAPLDAARAWFRVYQTGDDDALQ